MGKFGEGVTKIYEDVKKTAQEKLQVFKEKFMGSKEKAIKEIGNAQTSEEYIASLKKALAEAEGLQVEEKEVAEAEDEIKDIEEKSEGYEEAEKMNAEFDENKAAEKAAAESAEAERVAAEQAEAERVAAEEKAAHEEYIKKTESEDQAKMEELRVKLAGDSVEVDIIENAEKQEGNSQEVLIERLGSPKSEMFEKHGSRMREASDELVLASKELKVANNKLRSLEKDYTAAGSDDAKKAEISNAYDKVKNEADMARDKFNQLKRDASFGAEVIPRSGQKMGETYKEASDRRDKELKKYKEAAMNDPHVVLRMIEAGAIGGDANGDGLGGVAERLMSDTEFVKEAIKAAGKDSQGSYTGWFWRNVSGEARANKELFVEAVKVNHLNYQFGSKEFKSDPEIQKIALEAGLSREYLYKE